MRHNSTSEETLMTDVTKLQEVGDSVGAPTPITEFLPAARRRRLRNELSRNEKVAPPALPAPAPAMGPLGPRLNDED
jgi:hypothetical protein